jgi:hypothetical protein
MSIHALFGSFVAFRLYFMLEFYFQIFKIMDMNYCCIESCGNMKSLNYIDVKLELESSSYAGSYHRMRNRGEMVLQYAVL